MQMVGDAQESDTKFTSDWGLDTMYERAGKKENLVRIGSTTKGILNLKVSTAAATVAILEQAVMMLHDQDESQQAQMSDLMWKMEDFKNGERINNLRLWGLAEGMEGNYFRAIKVGLLREAFSELYGMEIWKCSGCTAFLGCLGINGLEKWLGL
ncbi:hypothetical protein NDU88_005797 [Pleurodeles waltl]|uniref:Uncharacterized protein n=1 Tax=Pleurodeles waltl TaxID=8319 RepID=A0AAV7MAD9_PLEWA|nr:hypothetical protein NDU88_005797 [Pleurodeles waltl]